MKLEEQLLALFKKVYEKQDAIAKALQEPLLSECSLSELHCIDAVGRLERPNVTNIATELGMTRGAISKITRRLMTRELLRSYSLESNRKEIYFSLTEKGKRVFDEHRKGHLAWEKRDLGFLRSYPADKLSDIVEFLGAFDRHLRSLLEE